MIADTVFAEIQKLHPDFRDHVRNVTVAALTEALIRQQISARPWYHRLFYSIVNGWVGRELATAIEDLKLRNLAAADLPQEEESEATFTAEAVFGDS